MYSLLKLNFLHTEEIDLWNLKDWMWILCLKGFLDSLIEYKDQFNEMIKLVQIIKEDQL